jgi:hypothetical protein
VEWILLMNRLFRSTILLFQANEPDPELNSSLRIITSQITSVLNENKVPCKITVAERPRDFATQVISYAVVNHSNLVMIMTMPGVDIPGFSFTDWDERLMFNEAQVPVMCINPVELGDYYYEWMMLT